MSPGQVDVYYVCEDTWRKTPPQSQIWYGKGVPQSGVFFSDDPRRSTAFVSMNDAFIRRSFIGLLADDGSRLPPRGPRRKFVEYFGQAGGRICRGRGSHLPRSPLHAKSIVRKVRGDG